MYKILIFIAFILNLPAPGLNNLPVFSFSNLLTSISFKLGLFSFSHRVRYSRSFNVMFPTVNHSKGSFHQSVKRRGLDLVSDLGKLLWVKHRSRCNSDTNGWHLSVLPMKEDLNHTLCLFKIAWNQALCGKIECVSVLLRRHNLQADSYCCR